MENPVQASQSDARQFTCPICRRLMVVRPSNSASLPRFFPFCSERCKLIDLGAWFDSEYRFPGRPDDEPQARPAEESPSQ